MKRSIIGLPNTPPLTADTEILRAVVVMVPWSGHVRRVFVKRSNTAKTGEEATAFSSAADVSGLQDSQKQGARQLRRV